MKFSYNWLQSYFDKKLPEPKKLAELLTLRFFEVEEILKKGKDWSIDISVLPNRAGDCFSHIGIAREIAAILDLKFKENYLEKSFPKSTFPIKIKDQKDCPRYNALFLNGVKVASSPLWLQERLVTCGLQPINNIVDIANYAMLETGQPLHAFDLDKISKEIVVRRAKLGEKITCLDDKKYILDKDILVIADNDKVLGIAGIKGAKSAEIDNKTQNIVVESANFNRILIRKASAKLKLRTDASLRFEHGLDPNLVQIGIIRAGLLMEGLTKGKIKNSFDFYPQKIKTKKISLDLNYLESLLGQAIPLVKVKKILLSLGFKIRQAKKLEVEIPTRRSDILDQEDLIEEVGRIYGYENIPSIFPKAIVSGLYKNSDLVWQEKIKDILARLGLCEVYNYSFISDKQAEIFGFQSLVGVEKPVSLDQKYLRPSLVPHILKNISDNQRYFKAKADPNKNIQIFELGKVFDSKSEKTMIMGALTTSFLKTKGTLEVFLDEIGLSDFDIKDFNVVSLKKGVIGKLYKVPLNILKELKIKPNVFVFEIDFGKIISLLGEKQYKPFSKFPAATRDISVLVPEDVSAGKILTKIKSSAGSLLSKIEVFDIYQGKEIPQGKKNLAFRLIYLSKDKTLTTEEINNLQSKIINALEKELDWKVRK